MGSRRRPFPSQTLRAPVAEIHFTIKRSEHGVNYGLPAWGDDVALTVAVEGICKLLTLAGGQEYGRVRHLEAGFSTGCWSRQFRWVNFPWTALC